MSGLPTSFANNSNISNINNSNNSNDDSSAADFCAYTLIRVLLPSIERFFLEYRDGFWKRDHF